VQRIPLSLAKPGMILDKPLLRDNGLVLVAEGTELSESLLMRLANMDIETVVVKGNPVDMNGAGGGSSFSQRAERLDHLFRKYQADPFMLKLKERLMDYFKLKAAAEAAAQAAQNATEPDEAEDQHQEQA
jgi:hypothetical protein